MEGKPGINYTYGICGLSKDNHTCSIHLTIIVRSEGCIIGMLPQLLSNQHGTSVKSLIYTVVCSQVQGLINYSRLTWWQLVSRSIHMAAWESEQDTQKLCLCMYTSNKLSSELSKEKEIHVLTIYHKCYTLMISSYHL